MPAMRLLILTHQYFPRHVGGTEVLVRDFCRSTRGAGHEPAVLAAVESTRPLVEQGVRRTSYDGSPVYELHIGPWSTPDPAVAEFENPLALACARRVIDDFRPDVVLAFHGMKLTTSALQAVVERGIPLALVLTDFWFFCPVHTMLRWDGTLCGGARHDLDCVRCLNCSRGMFDGPWQSLPEEEMWADLRARDATGKMARTTRSEMDALLRRPRAVGSILKEASAVVALTETGRRIAIDHGVPGENLHLLPHGLDAPAATWRNPSVDGPPTVAFIGPSTPAKGLPMLLDALALVPDLRIRLRAYCPVGADRSKIAARHFHDGRLDPRVEFPGVFPPEQLESVLLSSHVLAAPAQWIENGPLVTKFALSLGLPVLASDVPSMRELMQPGENGLLIERDSPAAWASALEMAAAGQVPGRATPMPNASAFHHSLATLCESLLHQRTR